MSSVERRAGGNLLRRRAGGVRYSAVMKERRLWLMLGIALDVPLVCPNWSRISDTLAALRASLGYKITLKAMCGDDTALYSVWRGRLETISADVFVRLWRALEAQGVVVPYSDLILPVAHGQRLTHKRIVFAGKSVTLAPLRLQRRSSQRL